MFHINSSVKLRQTFLSTVFILISSTLFLPYGQCKTVRSVNNHDWFIEMPGKPKRETCWFFYVPTGLYILAFTHIHHNYILLKLNHISFQKWMYFFLAFSFIKIRKYRIVIEFIHVLDALSWLKMSLTFRSDFIDNMHTFCNVARIYLNLHLVFMHFQFHEIHIPQALEMTGEQKYNAISYFFCHITYIIFFSIFLCWRGFFLNFRSYLYQLAQTFIFDASSISLDIS